MRYFQRRFDVLGTFFKTLERLLVWFPRDWRVQGLADVVAMLDRDVCGCGRPGIRSKHNVIMETSTISVIE